MKCPSVHGYILKSIYQKVGKVASFDKSQRDVNVYITEFWFCPRLCLFALLQKFGRSRAVALLKFILKIVAIFVSYPY